MLAYGEPHGDTAMAVTVKYPQRPQVIPDCACIPLYYE
jgi:hypothetical protein